MSFSHSHCITLSVLVSLYVCVCESARVVCQFRRCCSLVGCSFKIEKLFGKSVGLQQFNLRMKTECLALSPQNTFTHILTYIHCVFQWRCFPESAMSQRCGNISMSPDFIVHHRQTGQSSVKIIEHKNDANIKIIAYVHYTYTNVCLRRKCVCE